ncbi:MAG TPA: hypothetical protein PLH38_02960 [Clostridia bacterium]|nr:hypothetical protein [Clostridia bacterium]
MGLGELFVSGSLDGCKFREYSEESCVVRAKPPSGNVISRGCCGSTSWEAVLIKKKATAANRTAKDEMSSFKIGFKRI